MAVQSQIITCPAGQWTSIAQQLDRRQALLVQCPEQATTTTFTAPVVLPAAVKTLVTANPLRKSLMMSAPFPAFDMYVCSQDVGIQQAGICLNVGGAAYIPPYLTIDEKWGKWAQSAWFGMNTTGAGNNPVYCWQEIYTCRAIILGINSGTPTYTGPWGTVPIGIWTSPDLSQGPAIFRLSAAMDFELTTQEWFAWPVGSGNVSVQVYQSFDSSIDVPPTTQDAVQVRLPRLSPMALSHLEVLKKRLNGEFQDVP